MIFELLNMGALVVWLIGGFWWCVKQERNNE
jgi:hypothetical protein